MSAPLSNPSALTCRGFAGRHRDATEDIEATGRTGLQFPVGGARAWPRTTDLRPVMAQPAKQRRGARTKLPATLGMGDAGLEPATSALSRRNRVVKPSQPRPREVSVCRAFLLKRERLASVADPHWRCSRTHWRRTTGMRSYSPRDCESLRTPSANLHRAPARRVIQRGPLLLASGDGSRLGHTLLWRGISGPSRITRSRPTASASSGATGAFQRAAESRSPSPSRDARPA
jgi:hypothetical protein